MENKLLNSFSEYIKFGITPFFSSNICTPFNFSENNSLKAPFHSLVEPIGQINLDWATGIGAILDDCDLMAIDIDGCIDPDLLEVILSFLDLPANYAWIIETGSREGYSIILNCEERNKIDWTEMERSKVEPDQYIREIDGRVEWNYYINGCRFLYGERIFGQHQVDAFFPHKDSYYFSKIEFRWAGAIILPPSLHNSGWRYKFKFMEPKSPPLKVGFKKLFALKNVLCSYEATYSEFYQKQPYPAEFEKYHFNTCDHIALFKLNLYDGVSDSHYAAKASWLILDEKDGGPVKRATRLSYLNKHDYNLNNLFVAKCNNIEHEKIALPIRQVLSEFYLNLSNVHKIYFDNAEELNYIIELFYQLNLPIGNFYSLSSTSDLSKIKDFNNTSNNKCSVLLDEIMEKNGVSDYIGAIESNIRNLKQAGWLKFSDSVSIYDLLCKYHIYEYAIKYAERFDLKEPESSLFNSDECFSSVDINLVNFQVNRGALLDKLRHQLKSEYYSRLYEPFMKENDTDWSEDDFCLGDL